MNPLLTILKFDFVICWIYTYKQTLPGFPYLCLRLHLVCEFYFRAVILARQAKKNSKRIYLTIKLLRVDGPQ